MHLFANLPSFFPISFLLILNQIFTLFQQRNISALVSWGRCFLIFTHSDADSKPISQLATAPFSSHSIGSSSVLFLCFLAVTSHFNHIFFHCFYFRKCLQSLLEVEFLLKLSSVFVSLSFWKCILKLQFTVCAAGRRVSLVAPSGKVNALKFDSSVIKAILQEDSEKKIPFEFIDDIRVSENSEILFSFLI